jgi:hypothetical protein
MSTAMMVESPGKVPGLAFPARGTLQRKCDKCPDNDDEKKGILQRYAFREGPGIVPPIVHEVLRSPGQPLDPATRAYMEPRFGYDFSRVRVHTDAKAAESARAVNARAYTVGNDIIFREHQYAPAADRGQKLLAHELAHVIQQRGHHRIPSKIRIERPDSEMEAEAGTIASEINSGKHMAVRHSLPERALSRLTCEELLSTKNDIRVNGCQTHAAIADDFKTAVGDSKAFPVKMIPGASWAKARTECGDEKTCTEAQSSPYSGFPGYPDIAYLTPDKNVELAEIKYAHPECWVEGISQVENYVRVGNSIANYRWRNSQGIGKLQVMPEGRFTPTSPVYVGSEPVSVSWCRDGLIMYKAVRDRDPEVFLCRYKSDQGKVDQFLNRILTRCQGEADRYFNEVIDPALTRAIQSMSIRQVVQALVRFGRAELQEFLAKSGGLPSNLILEQLSEEQIADYLSGWLEKNIKDETIKALRKMALIVKERLLDKVREQMKIKMREFIQESLDKLCVGVLVTSAALLNQFTKDLMRYFGRTLAEVTMQVVQAFVNEFTEIAYKILAVFACIGLVIAAIFLLPEEILGAIGTALAWLVRAALTLIRTAPMVPTAAAG